MDLIAQVLNELVNPQLSISGPLLKTKVLAARIGNDELLQWVNGELNGFKHGQQLPPYRITTGDYRGDYVNNGGVARSTLIPLHFLTQDRYDELKKVEIIDSITSIETRKGDNLTLSIGSKIKDEIEASIVNAGNPNYHLIKLTQVLSANLFPNILAAVRTKLIDFMLEVEKTFGQEVEILSLMKNQETVAKIVNTTINNNGDGNVVNTGNNADINATITISKGNKEQLAKGLRQHHVPDNEIHELLKIVDHTTPSSPASLTDPINKWIGKMLQKSLDGTWQIGIGAAGGILTDLIGKYYGL